MYVCMCMCVCVCCTYTTRVCVPHEHCAVLAHMCVYFIYIYIYIYIYIVIIIYIFIWWSPFIPSKNLDEVLTYNHITLMSLRSRSHAKESMVLTRVDLFIYKYIR